jgi:hypothetical protein
MALSTRILIKLNISLVDAENMGTRRHDINENRGITLTDGTGANKADTLWDDVRTLTDAASEELDLQDGTLTDSLGNAVTMDILRGLYIKNTSTDASLLIGGAAATQLGLFANGSDILTLPPGGEFVYTAPDVNGLDTTTNPHLKLAHNGVGTSDLIYHIVAVGED